MRRIYRNATKLRIVVDTKCDLSGMSEARICWRKPCGKRGYFKAAVKDKEKGLIFYDVRKSDGFDQSGWWTIWPEVFFDDGRFCAGRSARVFVYERGD